MKKAKALKAARTSNKKIKPVKAFTGLEVALLAGAAGLAGSMMSEKPKSSSFVDPFKKYDPAMTPSQYVAKQTSATDITGENLNPVTSSGESASRSMSTETGTTANEQEETKAMKKGGMVRGQGAAIRGTKFKGVF
jgi:hypothetical protein